MNPAQSAANSVGPPVNPVLGVAVLADVEDLDFVLEGPLPLEWQRSYCSTNENIGWFGRGWSSTLEVSLRAVADPTGQSVDHIDVIDLFGRRISFPYVAPGASFFSASESATLARSAQGQYRLDTSSGMSCWFHDRSGSGHRLAALTDRNGNAVHLDYRESGGRIESVHISCSGGQLLELVFNHGRLCEAVEHRSGATLRVVLARYEYTDAGDLRTVRNRAGEYMRRFDYDDQRRLCRQVYAETYEAGYAYTGTGRDAKVVRHWDNVGQSWVFDYQTDHTAVTDQGGRTWRYHFDAERRWNGTTDPLGGFTRYGLDRHGNVRAVIDPGENLTETLFDERSNPVEVRDAEGGVTQIEWHPVLDLPVAITDPLQRTEKYVYDEQGNLVLEVDASGAQTAYKRDGRGLPVAITDAKGGTVRLQHNRMGQLTRYTDCSGRETLYEYDENGWLLCITDELGQRTRYEYDAAGRMQRETLADGSFDAYEYDLADRPLSVTNALGARTQFRYAADGRLLERVDALGHRLQCRYTASRQLAELLNENGAVYRFSYDALDRLVGESRFDGSVTRYALDANGRVAVTVDAPGMPEAITTRYRRDALGRMIERSTATGRAGFRYDAAGQLVEASNAEVRVRFQYDPAGRVVEEAVTAPGRMHALHHTYDPLGNRLGTRLPDGTQLGTLYYGSEHAHQINLAGEPITDFERDAAHRETSRTQGPLVTDWSYDPVGRLTRQATRVTASKTGAAVLAAVGKAIERCYSHDHAGRLITAVDRGRPLTYGYDALDRLTQFNQEHYAFDPAHNMRPAGAAGAVTDNRVAAFGALQYRYDAHGRVVERRGPDTAVQLRWNDEHLLTEAVSHGPGGSVTTAYLYDPFGRRIAKRSPQGTTWFVWDEDLLLQTSAEQADHTFVYTPDSYAPLAQVVQPRSSDGPTGWPQIYYYHCDQVGLPRELTDADGRAAWEADFHAWGRVEREQVAAAAGAVPSTALRYQGQYQDAETGLHYNFMRYYDPDSGRFLSRDPIGLAGGSNEYLYVFNPTGWIDPRGLTGTYIMSGGPSRNYVGKGPKARSQASKRARLAGCPKQVVVHAEYGDNEMGFMVEHLLMVRYNARSSSAWANSGRLDSPGKKKFAAASPKRKAEARRKANALDRRFKAAKKKCGLP